MTSSVEASSETTCVKNLNPSQAEKVDGGKSLKAPFKRKRENPEFVAFARRIIRAAGKRVAEGDPTALTDFLELESELKAALDHGVAGLRSNGFTWEEIGQGAGVARCFPRRPKDIRRTPLERTPNPLPRLAQRSWLKRGHSKMKGGFVVNQAEKQSLQLVRHWGKLIHRSKSNGPGANREQLAEDHYVVDLCYRDLDPYMRVEFEGDQVSIVIYERLYFQWAWPFLKAVHATVGKKTGGPGAP